MEYLEQRVALIEEKQKNDHEKILRCNEKIEKLDERQDKTDITVTSMSSDIKAIKDIVIKVSDYQDKERERTLQNVREFKNKIIWKIFETILILASVGAGLYSIIK